MSHYVYILHSENIGRYYVGESAFPEERLKEHNSGKYHGSFTKQSSDWEIFLTIECTERNQALKVEKKIKSMKSTNYIKNLKLYPEMIEKLLNL
ncbi:GIY-YIG nuclease family protein [uncultured Arcticibacterium sp.]|uniref:GIY-YIG nuclease family protein n=1 Tax=uncultured Arcticibacterium sp. TaxID=2173042 RepID=UPI0030F68904